jgi:hypothetical protein
MAKYRFYIGVGIGLLLGILIGWWHGFAGWPAWAALPFLGVLGGMVGYRAVSGDRRALVWLLLWVLPGTLVGFVSGVISQAAPVGLLHLALEYAIYAAIIGLLGPGIGRGGILICGLVVGVLGLAQSLLAELPESLTVAGVTFEGLSRVQYAFLNTVQALFLGAVLGGLLAYAIKSWREAK